MALSTLFPVQAEASRGQGSIDGRAATLRLDGALHSLSVARLPPQYQPGATLPFLPERGIFRRLDDFPRIGRPFPAEAVNKSFPPASGTCHRLAFRSATTTPRQGQGLHDHSENRLSGRTRRQFPHRLPERLSGLGGAALRHVRGRARRRRRWRGPAWHDSDRELTRRTGRGHPPPAPAAPISMSSANISCRSISSCSASRARSSATSNPSIAMSMRSANAARSSASWS